MYLERTVDVLCINPAPEAVSRPRGLFCLDFFSAFAQFTVDEGAVV